MKYRLEATVYSYPTEAPCKLQDLAIPKYKRSGYPDHWSYRSDELFTPAGLPIRFHINLDNRHGFEVIVAGQTMLDIAVGDLRTIYFELMLPTNELLRVDIREEKEY